MKSFLNIRDRYNRDEKINAYTIDDEMEVHKKRNWIKSVIDYFNYYYSVLWLISSLTFGYVYIKNKKMKEGITQYTKKSLQTNRLIWSTYI